MLAGVICDLFQLQTFSIKIFMKLLDHVFVLHSVSRIIESKIIIYFSASLANTCQQCKRFYLGIFLVCFCGYQEKLKFSFPPFPSFSYVLIAVQV